MGWEDKNEGGRMFYVGDDRKEARIDRDIMVLATLKSLTFRLG